MKGLNPIEYCIARTYQQINLERGPLDKKQATLLLITARCVDRYIKEGK